MADKRTLSKELIEYFGRETIENLAINLHQKAEDFLSQRQWKNKSYIDDELFFQFLEDVLVDIMRLKSFHEINNVNKIKRRAYTASWWVRRKPICFTEEHDKNTIWANELFALTLLLTIFPKNKYESVRDKQKLSEVTRHVLYHLKYRNINPQTLELFLIGLNFFADD